MNILRKIYNQILLYTPDMPPESGGIIGGVNEIITIFYADAGACSNENKYTPDIHKLNSIIDKWSSKGIEFYGIYHSHYISGTVLSASDKEYISRILSNTSYNSLYFPIVFPKKNIISYKAELKNNKTIFSREKIVLIN